VEPPDVPIPEVPSIADASIVEHPESGRACLLATTEEGQRIAFGFEVESDTPGLEIVDPALWLAAARDAGAPERSELGFEAVKDPVADDWLQALIAHPIGAQWLGQIKQAHPDAHHKWFAQTQYDEGGEEGAG
jgi:hypothetical protein